MSAKHVAGGCAFLVFMLLATFSFSICLLFPSLPLLCTIPPFRRRAMQWYHRWCGFTAIFYFGTAVWGLEHLLAVKVRIYGDALNKGERALLLSNHR